LVAIRYIDSERVTQLGLAELRGASIQQQDFLRADLSGLDLSGAVFRDCELRAACLDWSNLSGARFDHARLMAATFRRAHLRGASLRYASLKGADLSEACLIQADLTGASLRRANLCGANLSGAICLWNDSDGLKLDGAEYDAATTLPPGFRPEAHGMIRRLAAGRA
jgi:uncharacterized protein YjbI with pentapeptide repeats